MVAVWASHVWVAAPIDYSLKASVRILNLSVFPCDTRYCRVRVADLFIFSLVGTESGNKDCGPPLQIDCSSPFHKSLAHFF